MVCTSLLSGNSLQRKTVFAVIMQSETWWTSSPSLLIPEFAGLAKQALIGILVKSQRLLKPKRKKPCFAFFLGVWLIHRVQSTNENQQMPGLQHFDCLGPPGEEGVEHPGGTTYS